MGSSASVSVGEVESVGGLSPGNGSVVAAKPTDAPRVNSMAKHQCRKGLLPSCIAARKRRPNVFMNRPTLLLFVFGGQLAW